MNPFESLIRQLTATEPTEKNFKPIKKEMHAVLEYHHNGEKTLSFVLHQGMPHEQVQVLKRQIEQDLHDKGTEILAMACELYGLEPEPSNYRTLSLLLLRRVVGEPPTPRTKWTIDELAKLEQDFHRALEDGSKTDLDAWKKLARDPHWQQMASDIRHSEPENQRNRPEQTLTLAKTLRSQYIRSKREHENLLAQVRRHANQMRDDKGN